MESDKICGNCAYHDKEWGEYIVMTSEEDVTTKCIIPEDYLERTCDNCMSYGDWGWCDLRDEKTSETAPACYQYEPNWEE